MKCPACHAENLPGVDHCADCQSPLSDEITETSFAKHKGLIEDPIEKASLREPILVKTTARVSDVIRSMKKKNVGCALIVEQNQLLGIFTERDALRKLGEPDLNLMELEIQDLMTPAPEVLSEKDTIANALNKMSMGNYRHVPIRKEDGSITFFSVRDVLRHLF